MTGWTFSTLLVFVLFMYVHSDIYMQNPRGSNNRVNGQGRDRQNANRLFDSQNNARGGYNAGGLRYHVGSELTIEWTNQHSCGGPNNKCELVLQYMCDDKLRNGVRETTIPYPLDRCEHDDCNNDLQYGMHENYEYYERCYVRKRNFGLYTADQNMDGRRTARFTRQDNGGTRYGYECPEERDYYPYWHPTPWRDIAVLTNDPSRCDYYKKHSQNVAERWHCVPDGIENLPIKIRRDLDRYFRNNNKPVPQTEDECKSYHNTITKDGQSHTIHGKWEKVAAHGIAAPDCQLAPTSRDNHLGNGKGGYANTYNWTIPDDVHENCALRIRYNISTGEFPWETDSSSNGRNRNNQPCKACAVNLGDQLGIDEWDAQDRGYILTGNPDVLPLSINGDIQEKFELKLAVDTSQFGRTFEDRSHTFAILPRPDASTGCATAKIYNLNVRGKRGNIVQTYPATEYDYVPMRLIMKENECLHIQWTGSDNNPGNNAGQGRARTDRSNIVQLTDAQYYDVINAAADKPFKYGHWGNSYPARLNETHFLGLSYDDRQSLACAGSHTGGDIEELDENGPNYDLGVRKITKRGIYRYLCTRNNNFTNRGQKGVVKVLPNNKKDEESFKDDAEALAKIEADLNKASMMASK